MKKLLISVILPVLLLIGGCEKNDLDISTLKLFVSPDTLYIADADSFKDIYISVQPQTGIQYQITQYPSWLFIDSTLLKAKIANGINPIRLVPLKDNLEGVYSGKISIISDLAGTKDVYVYMSVSGHPKIYNSSKSIDFGTTDNTKTFTIENSGTGILSWSINKPNNWLSVSPTHGNLFKKQKVTITLQCNRANMNKNIYNHMISLITNAENSYDSVNVSMEVPLNSTYNLSAKELKYDYTDNVKYVYLRNTGNSPLTWSASSQKQYFDIVPAQGLVNQGDSVLLKISTNRTSIPNGKNTAVINFNNDANFKDSLLVTIDHFVETKYMLNCNVVDAEFCRKTNKIYMVTASPTNALIILDPETKTKQTVRLNKTPSCVSVNANGTKALVGHNGMVSYIDIASSTLEKECSISCDALDVVLTSGGWGYVFPIRDQWCAIHGVNLTTGLESNSSDWMIYAGTLGRLHPSEKYMYGADNGSSPSDIEKYDIQNGVASMLYDSPYHGDYPMNGNLWFSEDGDRIFTRGKTVLRSSELKTLDMYYNGNVDVTNQIQSLFHSKSADQFFVLTSNSSNWTTTTGDPYLYVFNYSYLNYLGKFTLESFMSNNKLYNAEGNFVFTDSTGKQIYVLTKANSGAGLLYEWALQTVNNNFLN
jgi:hypothetical protein